MPFDWIKSFQHKTEKGEDYAQKTLAAYRLGMRAGGSILGVRIEPGDRACPAVRALPAGQVYHPDEAPMLPLPDCPQQTGCQCLYRPVMAYERDEGSPVK